MAVLERAHRADSLAYSVEKTIRDNRQKIPVGDLSRIESVIEDVRKLSQGDDLPAMRRATEALQNAAHALAQTLYQQQAQQQAPSRPGAPKEGEVIDAEPVETADHP